MKKKINIGQLRPGMYVATTDRSWLQLPFFRKKISGPGAIEKLKAAGVNEVVIDLSKGLDVSAGSESREVDAFEHPDLISENFHRGSQVHDAVIQQTQQLMDQVRSGATIDSRQADVQVGLLIDQIIEDPQSMLCISVLKNSDEFTFDHCVNTSILALFVGKSMGLPQGELLQLGKGMLLHDIGKCMIPHSVLCKPGRLSDEEADVIRTHVAKGLSYLKKTQNVDQRVLNIVAQHHERLDGSGYPNGLKGDQISWEGKISGVIDVYDAMIHENFYKESDDPTGVLKKLESFIGIHYDEQAFKTLSDCIGIYPPGTILMLDSGEMALSYQPNTHNPFRPRVLLLTAIDGSFYSQPTPVCLTETIPSQQVYKRSILTTMTVEEANFNPFKILRSYSLQSQVE